MTEVIQEVFPLLPERVGANLQELFKDVTEDVSFCLKSDDVDGMGFPIAIAAAVLFSLLEPEG